MREIQGKIKFGVIDYNYIKKHGFTITDIPNKEDEIFILKNPNIPHWYISEITEEQAAEFVESKIIWEDEELRCVPVSAISAKESLISLLKANDVKTKEIADNLYDEIESLPDDLLLIKL